MKRCIYILLLLLLTACKSGSWFGNDDNQKLEGERITILNVDAALEPSYELQNVNIVLPYPKQNTLWSKSNGFDLLTYPHPDAAQIFTESRSASAGGNSSDYNLSAAPVIANGIIYTLDGKGRITAFDANNIKSKIWSVKISIPKGKGDFANAGVTINDNVLYITTGFNEVLALNASDGSQIWRKFINSISRSAPAVGGGVVLVNTIDNTLYALNAADGSIVWTHNGIKEEIGVSGAASPVIIQRAVIVAYSSGELYALRLEDGSIIWSESLSIGDTTSAFSLADIDASPVIEGNKVFAVSNNGLLAGIELETGYRIWERDISSTKTPWIATGFIYLITDDNEVVCVHAETGGIKWIQKLAKYKNEEKKKDRITWSAPVLAGSNILVVGNHGLMMSLSPSSGEIVNTTKITKNITLAPVIGYGTVFLYNNDAKLIALSGDMSASLPESNAVSTEERPEQPSEGDFFNKLKNKVF